MRHRRGRRDRHRLRQGVAVAGIRRYLLCLRNDASDTDSDSIPLSSLLDDTDTRTVDPASTLMTQMTSNVGGFNYVSLHYCVHVWLH